VPLLLSLTTVERLNAPYFVPCFYVSVTSANPYISAHSFPNWRDAGRIIAVSGSSIRKEAGESICLCGLCVLPWQVP